LDAKPRDRLLVYRIAPGGTPALVQDRMGAGDELAFAYQNPTGWKRLLIFSVDEHRHVRWYHPAWVDGRDDPIAIPISSGAGVHEIKEAVRHAIDAEALTIFGLFTNDPLSVKAVEARLEASKSVLEALDFPGSARWSVALKVTR
jgi:hypothetical protein